MKMRIANSLGERATDSSRGYSASINDQEFKTIMIQLRACGLIKTTYTQTTKGGMALFWSLTKTGERLMMESPSCTGDA